jgi:putative ABC transport system substrate-binding protein
VANLSYKYKIPVFSADPGLVEKGALASIGHSYEQIGRLTAQKVLLILEQKKEASQIPIDEPTGFQTFLNRTSSKKLGVILPSLSSLEGFMPLFLD